MRVRLIESVMIESHLERAWTSHQKTATAELLEARAASLLPLTQSSIVLNYLRRHHHKFEKGATTQLLVLSNRTAVHNNAPTPWLSSRTGGRHPCLYCIVGGRCHIPESQLSCKRGAVSSWDPAFNPSSKHHTPVKSRFFSHLLA